VWYIYVFIILSRCGIIVGVRNSYLDSLNVRLVAFSSEHILRIICSISFFLMSKLDDDSVIIHVFVDVFDFFFVNFCLLLSHRFFTISTNSLIMRYCMIP
jgi:hypothetical protein